MKNYILLIIWIIGGYYQNLLCQTPKYFEKNYGEKFINDGNRLLQLENGDYWVAGQCSPQNGGVWSGFLREISSNGNLNKQITYDYDRTTIGVRGFFKIDNEYLLVGISKNEDTDDLFGFILVVDEYGTAIHTQFTDDAASYKGAVFTLDGGILLSGHVYPDFEPGVPIYRKPFLIKLNANYEEEWSRTYPEYELQSWFNHLKAAPDGSGYYLYGTKENALFSGDLFLLKIDKEGNKLWEETYDLGDVQVGASMVDAEDLAAEFNFTQDGGFILSAAKDIVDEAFIIKMNSEAEVEWMNNEVFEKTGSVAPIELEDGTFIASGLITNPIEGQKDWDVKLAKLDESGNVLWERKYGGSRNDYAYDMIVNNNRADGLDGFVICGRTESLGEIAGANVYLIKTNCLGLLTEPQTQFSAEQDSENSLTYHFTNHSQYVYPDSIDGGHFLWDFGDGTTSTDLHPSHEYANKGESYSVTLTAVVCSDTSVFEIKVVSGDEIVGIEGVESLPAFSFKMYPNPTNGKVFLDYDLPKEGLLQLYDLQGKEVDNWILDTRITNACEKSFLDLGDFAEGMYLYRLSSDGVFLKSGKLVVE